MRSPAAVESAKSASLSAVRISRPLAQAKRSANGGAAAFPLGVAPHQIGDGGGQAKVTTHAVFPGACILVHSRMRERLRYSTLIRKHNGWAVPRMQEYDVALKLLLQGSASLTAAAKWLDVELPKVQNLRLDLLGETVDGGLVHVELQSGNDAAMPLRMAEYCLGIFRLFGRFPRQVVLYVGEPQLRMENELRGVDVLFRYGLIDMSASELEDLAERVLDAKSVEELLR